MSTAQTGPQPGAGGPAPAPIPRLARSAGLIGLATMTSRILGLVRDQVLAYLFGAGNAVDAYNVAFRIPNLVRDLFAEGAMSAAFVPAFTRTLGRPDREAAWRLGNNVISTLLVATTVLVVAGVVWAEPLASAFASDYRLVPGKLELTVLLTRLMLPFLIPVTVAAACMGMLNALNRFFVPALAPATFNVASIACVLALVSVMPRFGLPPITAMAIGALVGGVGQVLLQWPLLRRDGYRYRFRIDLRDSALREVLVLMGPGTLGLAATQLNVLVNTLLATSAGTGAVSWLNYAFRLMYLPLGLFGVSIATAALPAIARHAAREDLAKMRHEVASGLAMMLALNIPATFGLIVLARPIVVLLFERGAFRASDSEATAAAVACYAVGLVGYSAVKIASPTFYALRDSRTPVAVSAASVLTNVALNVILVRRFGYLGLAAGTSITSILNASTLLGLLRRRLGGLEGARLAGVAARATIAAVAMAGAAWILQGAGERLAPGDASGWQLARVAGTIGGALIVLLACGRLLRLEELDDIVRAFTRRVR